jgi:hypothetical protein
LERKAAVERMPADLADVAEEMKPSLFPPSPPSRPVPVPTVWPPLRVIRDFDRCVRQPMLPCRRETKASHRRQRRRRADAIVASPVTALVKRRCQLRGGPFRHSALCGTRREQGSAAKPFGSGRGPVSPPSFDRRRSCSRILVIEVREKPQEPDQPHLSGPR